MGAPAGLESAQEHGHQEDQAHQGPEPEAESHRHALPIGLGRARGMGMTLTGHIPECYRIRFSKPPAECRKPYWK